MLFSRFAQSAAALLLLTIGFAAPAHAQQNKQIISGTWYEDRAQTAYTGAPSIIMTFAQTPTNQFLNITNVACNVQMIPAQAMSAVTLYGGTNSGNNDLGRPYPLKGSATPEAVTPYKYYSIVQNGIFYKFGPGRYPSIEIDTGSSGSYEAIANCTIVGNLTDN